MNSIGRRTRKWLLAALLLTSWSSYAGNGVTATTNLPSEQRIVTEAACLETVAAEVEQAIRESESECSATSTQRDDACEATIDEVVGELSENCNRGVDAAVAAQARHYEPIVAGLQVEKDEWQREAELRAASEGFWRVVAGVASLVALGAVVYAAVK